MCRTLRIEQSPLERARLWVEILALLAAGGWAIYTFVYQTRIAPMLLPPHELVSLDVQRIARLPSSYVERVSITLHNDSSVDIDTAALTETVYAANSNAFSVLRSSATPAMVEYRSIPARSWDVVQSRGMLFNGSVAGKGGSNIILRPGDSQTLQFVAVVSTRYSALRVRATTIFGRYPIEPRVVASLASNRGAVLLKADFISMGLESYFSV